MKSSILLGGAILEKGDAVRNSAPQSFFTEQVKELVALGAAYACNCEVCFKFHFDKARKIGVTREDMLLAVETAEKVKASPAEAISHLAEKYLRSE
jgi:AhpD family alkylhydroperoxidase